MKFKQLSLRVRIFVGMIVLILLASLLIAAVTIYQYNEETKDYHQQRLVRKEKAIKRSIDFTIRETSWEVITERIPLIFKKAIFDIDAVHNLQVNLYDLQGNLLISSKRNIIRDTIDSKLGKDILNALSETAEHRHVIKNQVNGQTFQSSYSYITDEKFKTLAILNLPYLENDDFLNKELNEFLLRLSFAYMFMIFVAIIFAYFISKYITRSLKTISDKMKAITLEKQNSKIQIEATSEEIELLVNSYNSMIDELQASAVKLATSEREQAWREMAKQVAHEIKNPLTPMRLSVQSFQRKFDVSDPNINDKVKEYSNTLIQQIDTMSSIASAFSNFAKMPAQKSEDLNVVNIVKLALEIFNESYITFTAETDEIIAKFDRTQLIRVVTNLVKNSIQALPKEDDNSRISVCVFTIQDKVNITVEDNGCGITENIQSQIFEPKFTTKTSGMGLGLAMVKNIVETYGGSITFTTELGKGTMFKVSFPIK